MKKLFIVGLMIAALAIGCSNPLGHSSSPSDSSQITPSTSVHFSVKSPSASGVSPSLKKAKGMTVAFVTVTATRAGNADITANLTYNASTNTSSGDMTGLSLGQWTFLAKATDSSANVLFSGQTIYTVVSGTNSIAIDLYENIGAIKVVAGWGLAGGFADLKVTATRATFTTTQDTEAVPAQVTSGSAYLINLAAGDWSVVAEGYDSGVCYFRSAATTVTVSENVVATQSIGMTQIKVTPVSADPAAGTYSTAQSVALSTSTAGASIYYRLDGVDPGADLATAQGSATLYSAAAPIAVSQNTNIEARAYLSGVDPTDATALNYLIQAEAPTFNVDTGTYPANQSVTISTTLIGATIRYTTDNSVPTDTNGIVYSSSSPVAINGDATGQTEVTTHLKAIVIKSGCAESPITSADYTITGTCAAPTITPDAGTYPTTQNISLASTTPGASIRYTTGDGTQVAPTSTSGTLYSSAILISHNTTIKAIAYKTNWADSSLTTKNYTLDLTYITLPSSVPAVITGYAKMASGSTYHIAQNTAVDSNAILLIEPGATIKFDGVYYMRVDGTMIANGSSGSHIVFTSNQATPTKGNWDSVRLNSTTSEVSYCDFSYADGGLEINASMAKDIDHCNFSSNSTGAQGLGTFSSCTFTGNSTGGSGSSSFKVCTFTGNVYALSLSNYQSATLSGCMINGNGYGIDANWYATVNVQTSTISGNTVGIRMGVGVSASSLTLNQTTLSANTSCGILISELISASVSNCNLEDASAVVNNSIASYDFSNNYWGTTTESAIQTAITDFYDAIAYGKISYTPWLTSAVTW